MKNVIEFVKLWMMEFVGLWKEYILTFTKKEFWIGVAIGLVMLIPIYLIFALVMAIIEWKTRV